MKIIFIILICVGIIGLIGNLYVPRFPLGIISQIVSPGYGHCGKCGITWNHTDSHTTMYSENSGIFPLDEHCWNELTIEERLPYYREWFDKWGAGDINLWNAIKKAVEEGK